MTVQSDQPAAQLQDPLSDTTRKERRALLAVSLTAIAVARAGFLPTKVSALGLEFERTDQRALLLMIVAVIAYYMVAFVLHAVADFFAWRIAAGAEKAIAFVELMNDMEHLGQSRREIDVPKRIQPHWPARAAHYWSYPRAAFEFLLPILVSSYALLETLARWYSAA